MKKRVLYLTIAALVLGLVAFVFSPASDTMFAASKFGSCRKIVKGEVYAGAFRMPCRFATVYYAPGACIGKCAALSGIPKDARADLDLLAVRGYRIASYLYVRTLDKNKHPTDKAISVCFDKKAYDDVKNPQIFTYKPGTGWWFAYTYWDSSGALCSSTVGETSFALVGEVK